MSWVSEIDIYDVLFVAGWLALEIGVAMVSVPAAWMVGGLVALGLALAPTFRKEH